MFAVIIASKDRAELLDGAIAASLDQTHAAGEIIVVDDGSTDGTRGVIAQWSGRGVTGLRTSGIGVTAARNAGLAAAREEWVVFLDDDDRPERGWLEQFERSVSPDIGVISTPIRFLWADGRTVVAAPRGDSATGLQVSLLAGAFAVRRRLLADVGGYLDGLTYAEHSELAMRLLPEMKRRGLRAAVAQEVRLTVSRSDERRSEQGRTSALLKVIDHHRQTFHNDPERLARWLSIAGVDVYRAGDYVRARSLLWTAFRTEPTLRRAARVTAAILRSVAFGLRRDGKARLPSMSTSDSSAVREGAVPVRTGVVILTFNRCEQVCQTVAAVLGQSTPPDNVVVVDNGSVDTTVDSVRSRWPVGVEVLELGRNLGAAAGRAAGMAHVNGLGVDWCWIVDDDSPPRSDALAELIAVAESVPNCAMVGVRGGYRRFGVIRRIKSGVGPRPIDSGARFAVGEVDFVHLDGSLIRADAIRTCGVPREDYFIMMEDVEYPLRLKRAGGRIVLVDADLAELKHLGSGGAWRLYYQTRNELLMARDLRSPVALFGWTVRTSRFSLVHARRWRTDGERFRMRALGAWHGVLNRRGMVVQPRPDAQN